MSGFPNVRPDAWLMDGNGNLIAQSFVLVSRNLRLIGIMEEKTMKKAIWIVLSALLLVSISGCGAQLGAAPSMEALSGPERAGVDYAEGGFADQQTASDLSQSGYSAETPPETTERLVIRNASLSIVVEDPAISIEEIADLAEGMGGFVVTSNLYETYFGEYDSRVLAHQGNITIRVPAERLDEALNTIKESAIDVQNEAITGQDVTEEYTDLDSRLRNLQSAEEQLREIMASATKTEDVLRVFQDLRQVREEIEVIQGRMKYLTESARLSSISVDLIPDVATQPLQIGRWQPQGTAKAAVQALISALRFLADAFIWAGICVLPVAAIIGVPLFFIVRALVRRRRAKKAAAEAAK
jgi:hypothetical protein